MSSLNSTLQPYHDPQDEPTADPIDPSFFDFDNGENSKKEALKGQFFDDRRDQLQLMLWP